jgi:hypothetical protein
MEPASLHGLQVYRFLKQLLTQACDCSERARSRRGFQKIVAVVRRSQVGFFRGLVADDDYVSTVIAAIHTKV